MLKSEYGCWLYLAAVERKLPAVVKWKSRIWWYTGSAVQAPSGATNVVPYQSAPTTATKLPSKQEIRRAINLGCEFRSTRSLEVGEVRQSSFVVCLSPETQYVRLLEKLRQSATFRKVKVPSS